MIYLTKEYGVEFTQVYHLGPGKNGGGGVYTLYSGDVSSVSIKPSLRPDGGTADMRLLETLKNIGSHHNVSGIIPIGRRLLYFMIKTEKRDDLRDEIWDVDKYCYLWQDFNNVLVKSNFGYSIIDKKKFKIFVIENEKIESGIIKNMLHNGNPIYETIEDLKNNCSPVNIIGQPSEAEDFLIKRYKLSIQWSKSIPLYFQIRNLKMVFPVVKSIPNQELLKRAKDCNKWHFDTAYLDEIKKNELLQTAKDRQLNIVIELDDLKEIF